MAGYIGSKAAVTQVDGYTKTEADARYVEGDDTLYVDQTNNKVGISTTSPAEELDISADAPSVQLSSTNGSGRNYGLQSTNDGKFAFYDGTAGENRMVLTSTGALLINTSSHTPTDTELVVSSEYSSSGTTDAGITLSARSGGNWRNTGIFANGDNLTFTTGDDGVNGAISTSERARITGSGNFLVGTVNTFDAGDSSNGSDDRFGFINGRLNVEKYNAAAVSFKRTAGNGTLVNLARGGVGSIGNISVSTSSASFNTNSDYRLKENVADLTGATDRLRQLQPKRFSFIVDPDARVDGFLAHEVSSVVPEAITGEHNEVDADGNPVYQGIDQSKLVPLLTAALQEAITEIETLKTKVAALEAG